MGGRIRIRDINTAPGQVRDSAGQAPAGPGFTGGQHGAIAFRGVIGWETLPPSTSGYRLQTNGPGADPSWSVFNLVGRATGTIATIVSSFDIPVLGVDANIDSATITSSFATGVV